MIWGIFFSLCLLFLIIYFVVEFGLWLIKSMFDKNLKQNKNIPDVVSLPDGSLLNIDEYPKFHSLNNLPEKGVCEGDLVICDPEVFPKIHVHDVVTSNCYLYVVDTCHKDGTYTLKRPGEKLERIEKNKINLVARYVIGKPYDDIVDIVL